MSYYEMEQYFKKSADLAYRDQKGLVKDKIYLGSFSKNFEENFEDHIIKKAIKEGWLKKSLVQDPKTGQHLSVYAWLEHDVKQRRTLPALIERIKIFVQDRILGPMMRWADFD